MAHQRIELFPLRRQAALLAALCLLAAAPGLASTVASCSFKGTTGDFLSRGIVVSNYSGTNIRRLWLAYGSNTAGLYHVTAQIHRGSFDGPLVGSSTIYINISSVADTNAFFDFGGAPVTPGNTLAIVQTYTGPGSLTFDTGNGALGSSGNCSGAYETEGTNPPLDTERRNTVGIGIDQDDLVGACIPSDGILCIDKTAGDRRFKVSMSFSHTGGPSGTGGAIPLASLGITHGGAFWFFSPDNPEVIVKVLNTCSINNKFWVFASAGTNVAFTLQIVDTTNSATKTYSNPDNNAALPIQDTSALSCP